MLMLPLIRIFQVISGTYYDSENDFYIYTDEVKHITVGDYESFTYSVKTKPEEKVIKNLFFSKVSENEFKSILITYDISEKSIEEIMTSNNLGKNPYLTVKPINTEFFSKIETSGDCIETESLITCHPDDGSPDYSWGGDESRGCDGQLE